MKEVEKAGGVEIFTDSLLRVSVVVRHGSDSWLVPKTANGWQRRQRLTLTPLAELDRLQPAHGISPAWLGILPGNEPQACPRTNKKGAT